VNIHRIDTDSIDAKQKSMSLGSAKIDDYILRKPGERAQGFDHEINVLLTLSAIDSKKKSDSDYRREISSTCPNNLVFVKKTTIDMDPGLKALRIHHEMNFYSTIIFVPVSIKEKHSLYAITMGHGWKSVQPFVDYNFQKTLPLKILSSIGANVTEVKSILGPCRSKAEVFRKEVSLEDLEYGDVCTTFSANIDTENVAEGKTRQKLIFPFVVADNIKVEVGIGRIKFFVRETIENLLLAINMLEVIYMDDSDKYIIKGSKLNRRVLSVGLTEKLELDKELSSCIRTMLGLANFELDRRLHTFDICDRFTKEYTMSTSVEMSFARQKKTLGPNPDLTAVLQNVWDISRSKSKSPSKTETTLRSPTLLQSIKISFSNPGVKRKSRVFHPLPKLLRGSFYSIKYGKFFLKFGVTWYTMDDDYLIGIQNKFQNILRDHLITSSSEICPLPLPWPQQTKESQSKKKGKDGKENMMCDEGEYNRLYQNKIGFIVGDKKTPRSIEYFDVLLDTNNHSYICHVKIGFGNSTRNVCSQLLNSYDNLTSLGPRGEVNRESYQIKLLEKNVFNNDQALSHRILCTGGNQSSSPNTPVFVMGLYINHRITHPLSEEEMLCKGSNNLDAWEYFRSLEAEKNLKHVVDEKYLDNYIKGNEKFKKQLKKAYSCNETEVYENLKSNLIQQNFIKMSQGDVLVTSKLMFCDSISDFEKVFPGKASQDLLRTTRLMLQKYTTHYDSLGAKLEIIRCAKILRQRLKPEQFLICEIFAEEDANQTTSVPDIGDGDLIGTNQSNDISYPSEYMDTNLSTVAPELFSMQSSDDISTIVIDESNPMANEQIASTSNSNATERQDPGETKSTAGTKAKSSKRKREGAQRTILDWLRFVVK
jgi:hypothetical protein